MMSRPSFPGLVRATALPSALAATLCVAPCLAHAQSVTVYGALDAGITVVSNEGGASNTKLDDSVSIGNRLGFKGVEDLGGGLKASFILENGFRVDNGALRQGGTMFGRQSLVGLSGDWGSLSLGNQYDFIADYAAEFNVSAYASGYAIHQGDFDRFLLDRFKNAVKYSSPTVNGFNAGAMYAMGETAGSLRTGSSWSAGAHYTSGAFTTGLAVSRLNNPSGLAAIYPYWAIGVKDFLGQTVSTDQALPVDSQTIVALGVQYADGPLALMANTTATTFKGFGTESTMRV
jgi:outer membrane protein OmpU